jgi:hypothetical protein
MTQIPAFNPLDTGARSSTESRFTALSTQDPFQPNDSAALLEQLNSIRSIESSIQLSEQIGSLVKHNQLAAASSMIGKFIGGLNESLDRVAGYVVSVVRQGDDIHLELDNGWFVPFENVETVVDPSIFGDDAPVDPSTGDPPPPPPATMDGLLESWGQADDQYDLNGDGVVDMVDLLEFLQQ